MGTTLRGIYVIYEGIDVLGIRIVMLHGNLNKHTVSGAFTVNHIIVERCLALV